MNFRMKDSGNFARNLPQSKEISAALGREVAPFIMSVPGVFLLKPQQLWFPVWEEGHHF